MANLISIFYINLDERADRNKEMIDQFNSCNIKKYKRYSAIKPTLNEIINCKMININRLWKINNQSPNINNDKDFKYIKGVTGCKLSHYNILYNFYKNPITKYLLILEDDYTIKPNLLETIQDAISYFEQNKILFNLLYLSTNIHNNNYLECVTKISHNILNIKKGYGNGTHAILYPHSSISYILNILDKSYNEIDNVYKNYINNRYVMCPMIGYQRESRSNIGQYRESMYFDNSKNIVFYGEIDKLYNFNLMDIKQQKYMIYCPNKLYNTKSLYIYNLLSNSLNIPQVSEIADDKEYIYLSFILIKQKSFILINDLNITIHILNTYKNLIYFINCIYNSKNASNNKLLYVSNNKNSILNSLISCNILNYTYYNIDINYNTIYVINLNTSIERKKLFLEYNKNHKLFRLIEGIKYNPAYIGCALTYKTILYNVSKTNLLCCKICEDDCIIYNHNIINTALNFLLKNNIMFNILSTFMVDITDNIEILKVINLNNKYKLLKVTEWTSTVYNIYHKSAYNYLKMYDNIQELDLNKVDKNNYPFYSIDRCVNFEHIWLIYPFPVDLINVNSDIWNINNNTYQIMKQQSLNNIAKKLQIINNNSE